MKIKSVLIMLFLFALSLLLVSCRKLEDDFIFDKWESCFEGSENYYRYIPFKFFNCETNKNRIEFATAPGVYTNETNSYFAFVEIERVYNCFDSKLNLYPHDVKCVKNSAIELVIYDKNDQIIFQNNFEIVAEKTYVDLGEDFYEKITNCKYARFTINDVKLNSIYFEDQNSDSISFCVPRVLN